MGGQHLKFYNNPRYPHNRSEGTHPHRAEKVMENRFRNVPGRLLHTSSFQDRWTKRLPMDRKVQEVNNGSYCPQHGCAVKICGCNDE